MNRAIVSILSLLFSFCTWRLASTQATIPAQASQQEALEGGQYDLVSATSTRWGDTGLFDVFSAYTIKKFTIAAAGFRDNIDRELHRMDVSNLLATFTIGVSDRVELFGRFELEKRIRAHGWLEPHKKMLQGTDACFDPEVARSVDPWVFWAFCGFNPEMVFYYFYSDEPRVVEGWTKGVGDAWLGGKVNLLSEYRGDLMALALRGFVKLPTADDGAGLGTGAFSGGGHVVVSKNLSGWIESSYYAGFRRNASGRLPFNVGNAFEWGLGASFPRKAALRGMVELTGSVFSGADFEQTDPVDLLLGVNLQMENGFFVSGGWRTNFKFDVWGETASGLNIRIGYHPGVRGKYVPPPPLPLPVNHPPAFIVRAIPSTVEEGADSTVTVSANDPGGDPLTHAWGAARGKITGSGPRVTWTAPTGVERSCPVTVTVDDGRGKTGSGSTNIRVHRKVVTVIEFEDLQFLFDRYDLTEEARRILSEAAAQLKENAGFKIEIEGHCCSIGTEEYNLALGARRADSVKDYLIRAGVAESRLSTIGYGESRPAHDNSIEVTRRPNRRGDLRLFITNERE